MRKFVCVCVPAVACLLGGRERERVLFIGTQFSILYTSMCSVLLGGREGKFVVETRRSNCNVTPSVHARLRRDIFHTRPLERHDVGNLVCKGPHNKCQKRPNTSTKETYSN